MILQPLWHSQTSTVSSPGIILRVQGRQFKKCSRLCGSIRRQRCIQHLPQEQRGGGIHNTASKVFSAPRVHCHNTYITAYFHLELIPCSWHSHVLFNAKYVLYCTLEFSYLSPSPFNDDGHLALTALRSNEIDN